MITRHQIAELARFDAGDFPVVSFYLNVEGRNYSPAQNVERTHQLFREANNQLSTLGLTEEAYESIRQDMDNITRYIGKEFDRNGWRGLAIFGSAARQFWQVYPLALPVEDSLRIATHPYVRPLANLQEDYSRYGVVLVDREKARLFVVDLDGISERERVFDDVPKRVRAGSWYGLSDKRIERHIDEKLHRHLKHVFAVLEGIVASDGLDRLIVYGTQEVIPEWKRTLPRTLAERVVRTANHVNIEAPAETVREWAQETLTQAERQQEEALIQQVQDRASPGGLAVIGLEETLRALYYEAAYQLVVNRDLAAVGFACTRCGRRFAVAGGCPECCAQEVRTVEDMIEEAVEEAFRQGAEVEFVSGLPEWTEAGGIGVLLRFPLPQEFLSA